MVNAIKTTFESLTTTQIIAIAVLALAVITIVYNYLRQRKLEQIRCDVYKLFLEVEHKYLGSEQGQKRMDEVLEAAYLMLPPWLRLFVTREVLRGILDEWFRSIKDLLDDGKANNSV